MIRRTTIVSVSAAATIAFAAGHGLSQPESVKTPVPDRPAAAPVPPSPMPDTSEIVERLEEQAATAEQHKLLEALVGTFKAESRMYMDPDPKVAPLASHGTGKGAWILGKRFVKVDTLVGQDAAKKELATEAMTIYGFDTRTQKYTVLALDTLGTYWVSADGDYDEESKELRLAGIVEDGGQKMKFKWVVKLAEKGNTTSVMLNIDGEMWMKAAEVVLEKK